MRVLLVSQAPSVTARAGSALRLQPGMEVVEVTEPIEAQRRVRDESFDALILDGDLVPKGGFSLLYEIRADGDLRGSPATPAIVLVSRPQDRFLATWSRADAVVTKPIDPFELAATLAKLTGGALTVASVGAVGD